MKRPARLRIHRDALRHNLEIAKQVASESKVFAVIKADAYGHGVIEVAQALNQADAFAVASVGEGIELREHGFIHPILALQGFRDQKEYREASHHQIQTVIHQPEQLAILQNNPVPSPRIWLKFDTGMGRLGFPCREAKQRIEQAGSQLVGLMTHFANADLPCDHKNDEQLLHFLSTTRSYDLLRSSANSAATLRLPDSHLDWVRPGIMLYGASPIQYISADKLGLKPVAHLTAPLIAVKQHRCGDSIGYGSSYICPEDMPVGVIAIGYGDGYPRHAPGGTPVHIQGVNCPIIGRVSMDMITIDLRPLPDARTGMTATLWGDTLPADEVAACARTIAYELFCSTGAHCHREYV